MRCVRSGWFFCLSLAIASLASAQAVTPPMPIHGHPQLAAYTDRSQMPFGSGQEHWPTNHQITPIGDPSQLHTHSDLRCGRYGEVAGPILCDFKITLHNNSGRVHRVSGGVPGDGNRGDFDWVFDPTFTSENHLTHLVTTLPFNNDIDWMEGGPDLTNIYTGHFWMDPGRVGIVHGGFHIMLEVLITLADGTTNIVRDQEPMYSMVDPSAPDRPSDYPLLSVYAQSLSVDHPERVYGVQIINVLDFLPLLPLGLNDPPWTVHITSSNYTAQLNDLFETQFRVDQDFHHGIPGRVLWDVWSTSNTFDATVNTTVTFDPQVIGLGTHSWAMIRNQPVGTDEQLIALLAGKVTIGDGTAPPPPIVCPAGFELMNGMCMPIPPPTPLLSCTGTVVGTMVAGSSTVTVTSGQLSCQ